MPRSINDEDEILLLHAGPSKPTSRAHSRNGSGRSSLAGSRRNSGEHMRKARLSDEETRIGRSSLARSLASTPDRDGAVCTCTCQRYPICSPTLMTVFKAPGDVDGSPLKDPQDHREHHEDQDHSDSIPLLHGGQRRSSLVDELEELEHAEGPNGGGVKGTLLDGIANVSYPSIVEWTYRSCIDGQFDHGRWNRWVSVNSVIPMDKV